MELNIERQKVTNESEHNIIIWFFLEEVTKGCLTFNILLLFFSSKKTKCKEETNKEGKLFSHILVSVGWSFPIARIFRCPQSEVISDKLHN
jgi:hypothetical protein